VQVRYELYDGIPLIGKQVRLMNGSGKALTVNRFTAEQLRIVEAESTVDASTNWRPSDLFVYTDYTFAGMGVFNSNKAVEWVPDPDFKTQVNYELKTPCLVKCSSPVGPDAQVAPGDGSTRFEPLNFCTTTTIANDRAWASERCCEPLLPGH